MKRLFNLRLAHFKLSSGMTLIELLIVITIIGLMSTIVLTSLNNSRQRAYDTKIKEQLFHFRTAAETYVNNQTIAAGYGIAGNCSSGMFADVNPNDGSPALYIDPANLPSFAQVVCGSDSSAYAVKVLLSSLNDYWCIDNKGASKLVNGPIGGSTTICP